jgi:glycine cleavage system aminomethyltransferase T
MNAGAEQGATTLYFGPWYRKSPYFEATQRYGCKAYDIYNHTYLPGYYDDPITEYWHLLEHVTIWDVGVERQVEITGPDAYRFTSLLTPRDLSTCAVGQCKYVVICDEDGGIINDPVLLRLAQDHFWLSLADSDVLLWAKGVAVNSGMDVNIGEPDVWPIQVQGPKSKDVIQALFGEAPLQLRYYHCMEADLDDIPVVISRTGWTGEIGFEIYLRDSRRGDELWERVMDAGGPHDIRPIAPCEARRIEAGIFNYRSDMTIDNNPFEVSGLERLVDLDKAEDFIGRAALRMISAEGVTRKLVGIEIPGEPLSFEIAEYRRAFHHGQEVGVVTDLIWSPRLESNIGYVWVPIGLAEPGAAVEVEMPTGDRVAGRTAALPFLDPRKKIPAA